MRNHRYVLWFLGFLCAFSLTLGVAYGQQISPGKLKLKNHARLRAAMEVTKKHAKQIMQIRGVVATATGIAADGEPVVKVFTSETGITGIPKNVDGFSVNVSVTGRFYALSHIPPDTDPAGPWTRPVPIGVSTGHPNITAGTIGARVTDGTNVFALSNNHVYADINNASIGDNVLQPGAFDEGVDPIDAIGTLAYYEPISFCTVFWIFLSCPTINKIDAAIAATSTSQVGTATPSDGYGPPNSAIHPAYGVPSVIGDETISLLLGEPVHKYGRTTRLTLGTVNAVNATVNVCYDQACSLVARFEDQIVITPGTFSAGGDSGSLIVTQTGNNPVGLLFAGSNTDTIANRIDLVLNRFGVTIDTGGGVAEIMDIATTDISVPANPVVGESTNVVVTVQNLGNQDGAAFDVILKDETENLEIGTANVSGLTPGESAMPSFAWTPNSNGMHTLRAYHGVNDANAANDEYTTDVNVLAEPIAGPVLEFWQGWVSTDAWTTVTLDQNYDNEMVVVCTPNYDRFDTGPAMARVRNAQDSSFEVGLARPWFGALPGDHWSAYVHCMVVRAGVYTVVEHGVKMEASKFTSTVTDGAGSWVGESRSYLQSYTNPVVVGQVISNSAAIPGEVTDWSVFWSRGTGRNQPPSSSALYVGRHTGQDPNTRPQETIGYVVIESGTGTTIEGVRYTAGLGSDTVRGVDNGPPYSYTHGLTSASTAILSQAGMDGGDGGWPILYGSNPLTGGQINIAIDEDWYWDSERRHTTEQVMYFVVE